MGDRTKIEWCDHTFNPWIGCAKVHEGCQNCYAEADQDKRRGRVKWGLGGTRSMTSASNWRKPFSWDRAAAKAGVRAKVFCASLADVFEQWDGPIVDGRGQRLLWNATHGVGPWQGMGNYARNATMDDMRRQLFSLIDQTPNLDWLLLTKRPANIRGFWPINYGTTPAGDYSLTPRANVWLGTSISFHEHAETQVPDLLQCRNLVPVLFLSCEPLLGPINLTRIVFPYDVVDDTVKKLRGDNLDALLGEIVSPLTGCMVDGDYPSIDWVIVGGETGPHCRAMDPDWVLSLRDQCHAAGTPFFFKQWGWQTGKSQTGRKLDGREWNDFPYMGHVSKAERG